MANGQPVIQGGVNVATSPTGLAATGITGTNKQAFSAYGPRAGIGLFGTALPLGPNLLSDDTGVFGRAQTTGVFGQSDGGIVEDGNGNILFAGSGVAGVSGTAGVGVHGSSTAGFGVLGQDPSGAGVQGVSSTGNGVVGQSATGAGVSGRSSNSIGVAGNAQAAQGVFGTSVSSAGVAGVSGSGSGVHGRSTGGIGVVGDSTESMGVYGSAKSKPGVRGDSDSNYGVQGMSGTGFGVQGWSTQGPAGVLGYSATRWGVQGLSVNGVGLVAQSSTGSGVFGMQTANVTGAGVGVLGFGETGIGVAAFSRTGISLYAVSRTNLAARFDGAVEVHGSFQVIGGPKSAVVRHRDGTHRQLYCVESPESWFEDFGEARVRNGVAKVKLDPDFAALVDATDYQVFLTSYGPVQLYVSRRTRVGFEISAMRGADGEVPGAARCGYRIVARRKDIRAPRLAKVRLSTRPGRLPVPDPKKSKLPAPGKVRVEQVRSELRAPSAAPPALKARRNMTVRPPSRG